MVLSSLDRANGYKVEDITLYPYDSDIVRQKNGINIADLVTKFSITESIYFLGLTLSMTIVDGVNIIEKFNLSGNEKIKIRLSKFDKNTSKNTEININFIITEYPLFIKSDNKKYQAYSIEGITEHAFLDKLISVSQYITGSPSSMIKNIMVNYLNYDESKILNQDSSNQLYDYIVPNIRPLSAIRDILKVSCDSNLAPLIAWETLQGFKISGYIDMINQDIYKNRTYDVSNFSDPTLKDESLKYLQELTTVLEFSSNLKMSKIQQAMMGAFSSRTKVYDYSKKTYSESLFDLNTVDDFTYLSNHTSFTPDFKIDNKSLNNFYESAEYNVLLNNTQNGNIPLNGRRNLQEKVKFSYLAQSEHITHELKLNGDFEFNTGNIIDLNVPSSNTDGDTIDKYLSGKYLVSTVSHNFDNSYYMQVKIQRDGQNTKLD